MLTIHNIPLDDPMRPYIIAEASGNHHQDYPTAAALVQAAADVGADAVKFQTFTAEEICADIPLPLGHDAAHDAWLQSLGVTRMCELFQKGGLPRAWHAPLKQLAASLGIAFLSTPFSVDAARFLVEDIDVPALKIASGDITFTPLLQYTATTDLPILLSTGAATFSEVSDALHTICDARGVNHSAYLDDVVVMHCRQLYPCPDVMANLSVIQNLQAYCNIGAVGWSDHTLSADLVPALAVAMGATVIEKHIRLDGDTTSVDAEHSLTPAAFRRMVETVRQVPGILGHGRKIAEGREMHERLWCRRSPQDWLRPTEEARAGRWG